MQSDTAKEKHDRSQNKLQLNNLQHTMTWFMEPCVTDLKALTKQFRNCFSCFFQTVATGKSITYERKAAPCASSASLQKDKYRFEQ